MHFFPSSRVLKQYASTSTLLGFVEGTQFHIRKIQQCFTASLLGLGIHRVINLQGLCAGSFGVSENMKLRKIERFDECTTLLKIIVGLSAYAHDHIYPDKRVGQNGLYFLDFMTKQRGIITTFHQMQHGIATGL